MKAGARLSAAPIWALIFLILTTSGLLRADVTGSILGTVRDPTGAVVAGATVKVTNIGTNQSRASDYGRNRLVSHPGAAGRPLHHRSHASRLSAIPRHGNRSHGQRAAARRCLAPGGRDGAAGRGHRRVGGDRDDRHAAGAGDRAEENCSDFRSTVAAISTCSACRPAWRPPPLGSIQQDRPVSGGLSAGNISVNGQRETANAFLVNGGDVSEGRNLGRP